jgi:DNA polymerase elongation subunit (family B)
VLAGYNINGYDNPWLYFRCLRNGLSLKSLTRVKNVQISMKEMTSSSKGRGDQKRHVFSYTHLQKHGDTGLPDMFVVDLLQCARDMIPGLSTYTLRSVCEHLSLELGKLDLSYAEQKRIHETELVYENGTQGLLLFIAYVMQDSNVVYEIMQKLKVMSLHDLLYRGQQIRFVTLLAFTCHKLVSLFCLWTFFHIYQSYFFANGFFTLCLHQTNPNPFLTCAGHGDERPPSFRRAAT